jgi:hypothetical protein
MYKFTIDFVGLCNVHQINFAELARRADIKRDAVQKIVTGDHSKYNRYFAARMLNVFDIKTHPPLFIEDDPERGPKLSVDWDSLNATDLIWLVKKTGQAYGKIWRVVLHSETYYNRECLGAVLNALGVEVYPPFYIESDSVPGEPYGPERQYHRRKKRRQ